MASSRRVKPAPPLSDDHYFVRSQQPLHALMLLLPFILVYEIGAFLYATAETGRHLAARTWIKDFLGLFGAAGEYLPGLAVVVVLVALHFSHGYRWRPRPGMYLVMAAESLALAVPLLLFSMLTTRQAVAAVVAGGAPEGSWQAWAILSIGAGIYEELVFRMFLIAVIHMAAVNVLKMPDRHGAVLAILISTALFAISHFNRDNPFSVSAFAFYFIAGFYFALIYLLRGFGIVAAAHALYDVMVIALTFGLWPSR